MMTESAQITPSNRDSDPSRAVFGPGPDLVRRLAEGLRQADAVVLPGAWSRAAVAPLRAEAEALDAAGLLVPAAIGRGAARQHDAATRSDRRIWLDALDVGRAPALGALPAAFEHLRVALNRELLLGLDEVEAHLACYPPGARYARHLDRFVDDDARVLSLVLYLNADWRAADGGQLLLELATGRREVLPESGTLVAFLSDRVWHEVLPTARPRWSVAAWFRRRRGATP